MSHTDAKLDEMLQVIEDICRYNEEITIDENLILRDIGYTLRALKMMPEDIKEDVL